MYNPFQPTLTTDGLNRLGLTLIHQEASSRLKPYIYGYLQINANQESPYPVMPDGTQALYISRQGIMLAGAMTKTMAMRITEPDEYFGIWFYPGALRYFFDVNLSDITNELVDVNYLPLTTGKQLHHEIFHYNKFCQRKEVCEKWLTRHFNPLVDHRIDSVLAKIYQTSGNISVKQLQESTTCSSRHLNRLFSQYIGISTKTFLQIVRVQQASRRLFKQPGDVKNFALELGFYDQSHLINTCKKILGDNPGTFFNRFMFENSKSAF